VRLLGGRRAAVVEPRKCAAREQRRCASRGVGRLAVVVLLASGISLAGEAAPQAAQDQEIPSLLEQRYLIGPGDVLRLFVWKEPEISGELTVRFDGKVTVPLLGDVEASGKSPQDLASALGKMFLRFLSAPQVTLGVLRSNSARFFVIGMVSKPGEFPLTGRTTVLQGLAQAGGFREFAKTDSILIVRQDKGFFLPKGKPSETFINVNYKKLESGKDLSENVVLRPGDTILVP
jgi:polysaccharide biosynthesis/export protein